MTKIIFCVGGCMVPTAVDDPYIKHDSAIIIEDERQQFRICLGMDRDTKLSEHYRPYYVRTLGIDRVKMLRDSLTTLINKAEADICKETE